MSETVIYGVKSNGEVIFVDEVENSYRGAIHVWQRLCEKYEIEGSMFGGFQKLWKLTDKEVLTKAENIVLKSTFDNVIVKKEDIPLLLEAFKEYDKNFPNSSLLEQAVIIEENILNNVEMIGVCWNQTSINSNPWLFDYNDEKDEEIPYNVFKGETHKFLNL